jgi:cyclic beta-1,2-glucan synthetase
MYRAGIEGIVGLTREGNFLCLNPCIPSRWPELNLTITLAGASYAVSILNPDATGRGIRSAVLDGKALTTAHSGLKIPLQDGRHVLSLRLGGLVS